MNNPIGLAKISKKQLRNVPNWENAPVPICMGGDYRALTFCCKPGHSLTFGFKCMRDEVLHEVGLSAEKFIEIKQKFSDEHDWDSNFPCFGSLSYCCMRQGGCSRRDMALAQKNPGKTHDEIMSDYFRLKRILAVEILKAAKNQELVKDLIEDLQ